MSGIAEPMAGLFDFLRLPSLSTTGQGVAETAAWLCGQAQALGAEADVYPTAGHPVVAGVFPGGPRTILLYGHYDVQPPEPLELWESDPFAPTLRDGKIYARGATDDKGNLWAALVAASHNPPVTVKFVFEGEEEVGSPNLLPFLRAHRDMLACDACVLCDRGIHESGRGQLYLGNKGMIHVELRATGPKRDVHSSQAHRRCAHSSGEGSHPCRGGHGGEPFRSRAVRRHRWRRPRSGRSSSTNAVRGGLQHLGCGSAGTEQLAHHPAHGLREGGRAAGSRQDPRSSTAQVAERCGSVDGTIDTTMRPHRASGDHRANRSANQAPHRPRPRRRPLSACGQAEPPRSIADTADLPVCSIDLAVASHLQTRPRETSNWAPSAPEA